MCDFFRLNSLYFSYERKAQVAHKRGSDKLNYENTTIYDSFLCELQKSNNFIVKTCYQLKYVERKTCIKTSMIYSTL